VAVVGKEKCKWQQVVARKSVVASCSKEEWSGSCSKEECKWQVVARNSVVAMGAEL
jgi:hypothetical protein